MNTVSKKDYVKEYMKNLEKKDNVIPQVLIVNTETDEIFPTNERKALADFERLSKKYKGDWSLFYPVGNNGR